MPRHILQLLIAFSVISFAQPLMAVKEITTDLDGGPFTDVVMSVVLDAEMVRPSMPDPISGRVYLTDLQDAFLKTYVDLWLREDLRARVHGYTAADLHQDVTLLIQLFKSPKRLTDKKFMSKFSKKSMI